MSFRAHRLHRLRYELTNRLGQIIDERGFRKLMYELGLLDRREYFQKTELFFNRLARGRDQFYKTTVLLADIAQIEEITRESSERVLSAARMFPEESGITSNRAIQSVRLERACLKRCKTEEDAAHRFAMCWEALCYVCEVEHAVEFREVLDQICRGDDVKHIREEVVRIIDMEPVYPFVDLPSDGYKTRL